MTIAYQVFHVDGASPERDACYADIRKIFGDAHHLDAETFIIRTREDYLRHQATHPNFVVAEIADHGINGQPWPKIWGQTGIWASTVLAYEKFLQTEHDHLLVFEDDVVLLPDFTDRLLRIMQELPEDYDFFSVFVPWDTVCRYRPEWHDIAGKNSISVAFQDWSCAVYVVSRKGARRVLDDVALRGIDRPIDWYMFNYHHRNFPPMRFQSYSLRPEVEPLARLHADADNSTLFKA